MLKEDQHEIGGYNLKQDKEIEGIHILRQNSPYNEEEVELFGQQEELDECIHQDIVFDEGDDRGITHSHMYDTYANPSFAFTCLPLERDFLIATEPAPFRLQNSKQKN